MDLERREYRRRKYLAPVDFASKARPYQRHIDDISQGGMRIISKESIPRGTLLTLCFDIPGNHHVKIFGEVLRSGDSGLAVEFHPSLAKGRLKSLLRLLP